MDQLTRALEVQLGPDTTQLGLRIGIHSGAVTAGILRGDRARFQLFGDTMAALVAVEAAGKPNRILVSQATANCIAASGKEKWLTDRAETEILKVRKHLSNAIFEGGRDLRILVYFKQGYWIHPATLRGERSRRVRGSMDEPSSNSVGFSDPSDTVSDQTTLQRLIDWNVDLLSTSMKEILSQSTESQPVLDSAADMAPLRQCGSSYLDEVMEIIMLPDFDGAKVVSNTAVLPKTVQEQLRDYVTCIASMYRSNDFHNFEHAR